jgi:DNA repair protein RecO (recombination protein O)
MGLVETEAIVLRTYNLADADKIAVCLTRSAGLVRAVAHGARRLKSKFGAGLEPSTLISLSYYEKEGRELVSIRQAEILRSSFGLAVNAEAVAALAYMNELVIEFAPPREPNEKLFRMLNACLEAAARLSSDLSPITRYFEIWLLKLAGFLPDLRSCADCRRGFNGQETVFANAEGKLRCRSCSQGLGTPLASETYARLRAMQKFSPLEYAQTAHGMDVAVRQELAQLTRRLIERALERAPRTQTSIAAL